jgi:hypothetical protein
LENHTAREIVQGNEQVSKLVNTLFSWKNEGLPKGILAMRKKVAQGNKQFAENGWDGLCQAFTSPRLRKRALSYMCLNTAISPNEAIAIVQYEICREHIKGEECVPAPVAS